MILVMVKRKVEEHYEGQQAIAVFEEERQVLSNEERYPDTYSLMEEYKSWSKHQDVLAKKRAAEAREEFRASEKNSKRDDTRPQFHQKKRNNRPQRSNKTTAEI